MFDGRTEVTGLLKLSPLFGYDSELQITHHIPDTEAGKVNAM